MTAVLLVLTLLFPFIFKYQYLITNQFTQIPIINSILDPNYLTNDWYVSLSRSFGPRTIFAYYMSVFARFATLPGAFFINYLLYIFCIIWSTYNLAQMLFQNKLISFMTTIFVLFGTTYGIGGNILITRDFSAPQLPLALIITALILLLQEKIFLSLLLIIFATYLHPLIGWEGGSLILFGWSIYDLFLKNQKGQFIPVLKIWGWFALSTLALSLAYFSELSTTPVGISQQILINILAFSRNPHHNIASTWRLMDFVRFLIFLATALFISYKIYPSSNQAARNLFKLLFIISGIILVLNLLGFVFTEIWPIYQVVVAQLFRNNLFLFFTAAVIFYGGTLTLVKKRQLPTIFLTAIFLFNQPLFSLTGKADLLAFIVFLVAGLLYVYKKYFLVIVLLLLAFYLTNYHIPFRYDSDVDQSASFIQLINWVKTNTPEKAVFIIPPEMEDFRLMSQRAVVADWKGFPFQKVGMWQWYQRMCDLGNIKNCKDGLIQRNEVVIGYLTLTPTDILRLAEKYQASYLISSLYYPSLKLVYQNDYFLYEINQHLDQ